MYDSDESKMARARRQQKDAPSSGRLEGKAPIKAAVLGVLLEAPGHGYEVAKRLNQRMGTWIVNPKHIYEPLKQLEKAELVRIQKFSPVKDSESQPPTFSSQMGVAGSSGGQLKEPRGVALDGKGDVVVADGDNNRIELFNEKDEFVKTFGFGVSNGEGKLEVCTSECKAGIMGSGSGQFSAPKGVAVDSKGDIWVADTGNSRLEEFNEKDEFLKSVGSAGTGGGQFKEPEGIAIDSHNNVWIADSENARVQELNEKGEFVKTFGFGVSNGESKLEVCTSSCKAGIGGSGSGQLNGPRGLAVGTNGSIWVADTWNNRVEEFSESGEYDKTLGSAGAGNGQFKEPKSITIDSHGDVWVVDNTNDRVQEFNEKGEYILQFGSKGTGNGQFQEPFGIQIDSHGNIYISDTFNNRIQKLVPTSQDLGNLSAHDTKTVYYTAKEETEVSTCRDHPEWAGLTCQMEPVAQPGTSGPPELPVDSTTAYNIWDEAETTVEKFGSTMRTKTETYDPAGRALTSEEIASPATDKTLPTTTVEYNKETGAIEKQSATIKGGTKTITSRYNTLGQLAEYVDAEGNIAKYGYEEGGDGRLVEESEGNSGEGESKQTYSYSTTTGMLEKLVDSAAGTFTASYDVEGKMISEIYPNGMCANTAYNQTGQAVSLQYIKTRNCAESKPTVWFSDTIVPGVHGETLAQTSTLAKESYAYNNDGRLTETQETPAGADCRSRLYAYNEEGDRTAETTRASSSETCASVPRLKFLC